MRYTVLWVPSAERDLAAIWTTSEERGSVASAANTIDALLREDATSRGEACFDTVRTLIVPPLGVDFEVQEDDRIVRVLAVWTAR